MIWKIEIPKINLNAEIKDGVDQENLNKYGFSVGGAIGNFVPLWRTYDFNKLDNSLDGRGKELKFD